MHLWGKSESVQEGPLQGSDSVHCSRHLGSFCMELLLCEKKSKHWSAGKMAFLLFVKKWLSCTATADHCCRGEWALHALYVRDRAFGATFCQLCFFPWSLKNVYLPCILQKPCMLGYSFMSLETQDYNFLSHSREDSISAFHIKVVAIRGFNSVFPVLVAYTAVKIESSAYKCFLGLSICDFLCVCWLAAHFISLSTLIDSSS